MAIYGLMTLFNRSRAAHLGLQTYSWVCENQLIRLRLPLANLYAARRHGNPMPDDSVRSRAKLELANTYSAQRNGNIRPHDLFGRAQLSGACKHILGCKNQLIRLGLPLATAQHNGKIRPHDSIYCRVQLTRARKHLLSATSWQYTAS